MSENGPFHYGGCRGRESWEQLFTLACGGEGKVEPAREKGGQLLAGAVVAPLPYHLERRRGARLWGGRLLITV